MTFAQLNYVLEIISCGSINKAAQNLFISQSSISNSIHELENELDIIIFNRTNRGIVLTEDGKEFVEQIIPIAERRKMIERYYRERDRSNLAKLSVSTQRFPFCTKAFVEFLSSCQNEKFEFTFKETDMDKVIDNVIQRKSDLGFIYITGSTEKFMKKTLVSQDLDFYELAYIKPHVYFNTKHPLSKKKKVSLDELSGFPYLVFAKKNNMNANFSEEGIFLGSWNFKKIIYINDRATAYNIMSHTDTFTTGSGILPDGYAPPNIMSVPLSDSDEPIQLVWIKLANTPVKPLVGEFVEKVKMVLNR